MVVAGEILLPSCSSIAATRADSRLYLALALCASLALLLRLYGIGNGYPSFVSGDERAVIRDAVHFIANHTLEPTRYHYPAGYAYLFSGALWFSYACGWLIDLGSAGASVVFAHLIYPTKIALVGRLLSALAACRCCGLLKELNISGRCMLS